MAFNLNRSRSADYILKEKHIHEVINIYGISVDYIFTTKQNQDKIMRDFSHLKLGDTKSIFLLPEDTSMNGGAIQWGAFGPTNARNINFFISKLTLTSLFPDFDTDRHLRDIVNSLIILPSGAIFEIADITTEVEGINNLFTSADKESVFILSTISYSNRKQNVVDSEAVQSETVKESFDNLDDYFNSISSKNNEQQDIESAPISNTDSIFGSLG